MRERNESRDDDQPNVLEKRLADTTPVLQLFGTAVAIDADGEAGRTVLEARRCLAKCLANDSRKL